MMINQRKSSKNKLFQAIKECNNMASYKINIQKSIAYKTICTYINPVTS